MIFSWLKSIRKLSIFFLLILLMSLYLLDAPAYAQCTHIGVCEFLEVIGICNVSKEINKIDLDNNQKYYNLCSSIYYNTQLAPFYVLKRYIHPYPRHKNNYLHSNKISINQKNTDYEKSPILSAKRIIIITSCIMRS